MSDFIESNEGNPSPYGEHYLGSAVYLGNEKKGRFYGVEFAGVNCAAHNAQTSMRCAEISGFSPAEARFLAGAAGLKYGDAEKYLQEHGPFSVSYDKAKRLFRFALEHYVSEAEETVNLLFRS